MPTELAAAADVVRLEHPGGLFDITLGSASSGGGQTEIVRTARKLMDGTVFPREY